MRQVGNSTAAQRGPVTTGDAPGRWIRTLPQRPQHTAVPLDREVDDAVQASAVHAGWLLVEAHERLSQSGAHRVFATELHAWHRYARNGVRDLVAPPEYPQALAVGTTESNRLRFRRLLDLTRPGDRVFDIGSGAGYLACLLALDAGIGSYVGIEIAPAKAAAAQRMLEVNDIPAGVVRIQEGDLYRVTADDTAGCTLLTCLEVLEHVPDPELALRTLAAALPAGADLLFSVPLHGRLENVWGHRTVFDAARVKTMLDDAGLCAQHVEPLANTWTLVLASHGTAPSARVREARRRPAERANLPLSLHQDFEPVPRSEYTFLGSAAPVPGEAKLCRVGPDKGRISFPVAGLESLRIRLGAIDLAHAEQIDVSAFAGPGRVCRWTWDIGAEDRPSGSMSFALRPGESGGQFKGAPPRRRVHQADRVEISVTMAAGQSGSFTVDAAYLP